jgi:hypothetical protein
MPPLRIHNLSTEPEAAKEWSPELIEKRILNRHSTARKAQ